MVEVRPATADDDWNRLVERSPQGTVFHRREFLSVLADHAGATLHPLVGVVGREPVGLFPVFETARGPVTVAFSPPPDLKVSYLGPALCNLGKLSARKRERRHRRFVEGCLDWLADAVGPRYVHVRTATGYADPRPFDWNGFSVTPGYTYHLDLGRDEEALFASFSGDARQNVRAAREAGATVHEGGVADVEPVVAQVRARHEEQGTAYGVTPAFVRDLYDRLPDGVVRASVVEVDGAFAGGMVTLEDDDALYRWQGGARPDADADVNDLLDWQLIRAARERGRERYDLVGANNPRLCGYKAKFAPDLATYRSLERAGPGMGLAASLYRRLR